jgi:hypothetical protein
MLNMQAVTYFGSEAMSGPVLPAALLPSTNQMQALAARGRPLAIMPDIKVVPAACSSHVVMYMVLSVVLLKWRFCIPAIVALLSMCSDKNCTEAHITH